MLKLVEFGLLAVSLVVIVGLIVSGARNEKSSNAIELAEDAAKAQEPGKAH
jgi:hypothetical protein